MTRNTTEFFENLKPKTKFEIFEDLLETIEEGSDIVNMRSDEDFWLNMEFRCRYFKEFYVKRTVKDGATAVSNFSSSLGTPRIMTYNTSEITFPITDFINYINELLNEENIEFINENFFSFRAEETGYTLNPTGIKNLKQHREGGARRIYTITCSEAVKAYFMTISLVKEDKHDYDHPTL